MPLHLYNSKPKSDHLYLLKFSPLSQIKTCVASIGGGAFAGDIAFTAFNAVATPIIFTTGIALVAFLSSVDYISDRMTDRAIEKGEFELKKFNRPKIDFSR